MSPGNTGPRRRTRGSLQRPATAGFRFGAVLLCAALVGGAAAGCGAPAPDLGAEAAKTLQTQVLAVTEAAAANDHAGSLKLLDELAANLDQAAASGDVSSQRQQDIRSAIDAVRADLAALQTAAEAARAAAEQAAAAEAAKAAAEQAAATAPPPAVVAPAPAPAPADKGSDRGSDQGKGKGKD